MCGLLQGTNLVAKESSKENYSIKQSHRKLLVENKPLRLIVHLNDSKTMI